MLKENNREEEIKNIYEAFFIYAVMWSFGAPLTDERISFNGVMKSQAKVKFPDAGQCYDYYYDPINGVWASWTNLVKKYEPNPDQLFQNIVVPTAETTRQNSLVDLHMKQRKAVLYVGAAGTGKTTILKNYFTTVNKELVLTASMNFNSYTDSKTL